MGGIVTAILAAQDSSDSGFSNDNLEWLSTGLNYVLHLFLVASLVGFCYMLWVIVREPTDNSVRLGRYMALFIGALIVVGAQASGSSYTSFIVDSLGESRSVGFQFFGALLPAAAGLGLGYYLTRGMKRSSERVMRVLLMVGTFCVTQFALMYAVAVREDSGDLGREVTPNVAFVAGLGLVLVLNLGIKDTTPDEGSGLRGLAQRIVGSRASSQAPLVESRRDFND